MSGDPFHCGGPESGSEHGLSRREMHWREISMRAFERSDGLYEVRGRVIDRKPHDHASIRSDRIVPAGEPVHDLGVCLVFDEDLTVRDVSTFSKAYPYEQCPEGGRALSLLKGLRMTAGWGSEVRKRLGGAASCTHLRELLMPMATTAFQAVSARRMQLPERLDVSGRPLKVDSCYAYGAERKLVQQFWPNFHREA